jgi:hypothetical protein
MDYEEGNQKHLYKVDYYEPEDECSYIDWVWLEFHEVAEYRSGYKYVKVRRATQDEENLYEEAYEDGYSIAMIMEMRSIDNGVTFRVELDEDGGLTAGHKMFKCAICDKHKDFDGGVATVNGFYITKLIDDVLWHVCYDCAALSAEINKVEDDY